MAPILALAGGAGQGLQEVLANHLAEEQMQRLQDQLAEEKRSHLAEEDYRNRSLDVMSQLRRDMLTSSAADKKQALIDKAVALRGIGDVVTPQELQTETTEGGVPSGNYQHNPGQKATSTIGLMTLPGAGPVQSQSTTTTDATSPLNAPDTITWKGTGAQRLAASNADSVQALRESQMQRYIDQQNDAIERLKIEGDSVAARTQLGQATNQIRELMANIAEERARNTNSLGLLRLGQEQDKLTQAASSPMGQPILVRDAQGNHHSTYLRRDGKWMRDGKLTDSPILPGETPVQKAPDTPDIFSRISGWFGGSGASSPQPGRDLGADFGNTPQP